MIVYQYTLLLYSPLDRSGPFHRCLETDGRCDRLERQKQYRAKFEPGPLLVF